MPPNIQNTTATSPSPTEAIDRIPTMNTKSKSDISKHVNANVGMKVGMSAIPHAGLGLFVSEDVKAGEVIFTIEKPLLCIVSSFLFSPQKEPR